MPYPSIIVLFTSYNCNARCIMCSAWQKQENQPQLNLEDIKYIFSDKGLKKSIQVVNLTGGEPTLRDDLVEIIKILALNCVNLKRVDLSTNGIDTVNVIDKIEQILAFLMQTEVKFTVSVSIDGVDGVHDSIRRTPDAFKNADRTIDELKELMLLYPAFCVGLNVTITKLNYSKLNNILDYSIKKGIGINFTLAAFSEIGVESIGVRGQFELDSSEKEEVANFVEQLVAKGSINRRYGNFLLRWLKTGERIERCAFRERKSILCEPDGSVYCCGNFRDFKIGNILQRPFEHIAASGRRLYKAYRKRCKTCNSNCYIDI